MKRILFFALWVVPALVLARPSEKKLAEAEETAENVATRTGAIHYEPAVRDTGISANILQGVRLDLGVRSLYTWLLNDRKGEPFHGSFIGSIYRLDTDANLWPIHPYVQAAMEVKDWNLGGGMAYSHLTVSTEDNGGGDGDIQTDALLFYFLAERPIGSSFTPFAEIGLGVAFNSFDAFDDWSAGGMRSFDLDDSLIFHLAGGCSYAFHRHWSADVYLRYMLYEVDGSYAFRGDSRPDEPFTFTPENLAVGLGLRYVF